MGPKFVGNDGLLLGVLARGVWVSFFFYPTCEFLSAIKKQAFDFEE